MIRWTALLVLTTGFSPVLAAQDTTAARPAAAPDTMPRARVSATLTLADAVAQARANSPQYRQTLNNANPARWGVRNAYGTFLPQVNASAGVGYTGSGSSNFGGTTFSQSSPSYNSDYSLNLNWRLDGRVLTGPGQAKAEQRAAEEDISSAGVQLKADVTTQYLQTLQNVAQVEVARQQVLRNVDFLRLAQARYQVGQATLIDVRQAEVTKANSDVQLLRAEQAANEAKLELLRRMGVTPPVPVQELALTDSFPVVAPTFELDQLMTLAAEQNPGLRSLRAQEASAGANVTATRSEYLPSITVNAGWSGFTQQFTDENLILGGQLAGAQESYGSCLENNQIRQSAGLAPADCLASSGLATPTTLSDEVITSFRNRNDVFPFNYAGQPFRASLTVSLPIFTGFGRSLRVAQARAQQQDANEAVRGRALQVQADVHSRYLALQTAYKSIAVQQVARDAAREQLRLAQDRYRLGSGTSLELSDAQNAVQRAEGDYVNAIYGYHIAIAALEAAVGRPLR
jgi:outer membrane protein TolC